MKHNKRNRSGFEYIKKLIIETSKNNQELIVVLSPVHSKYKELVDEKIYFNCKDNLIHSMKYKLIDGFRLNVLSDKDFWDFDHLRPEGAKKFTEAIRKELEKND